MSVIAPWLVAAVLIPMPATAANHTEDTEAPATVTEELVKLTPSDGTPIDQFGNHVAVSGDTAVVGAPNMHAFAGPGAAYVFTRVGETWTEQARLKASDGVPGDRFGWSVAISGDTIVVSAMWDDVDTHVDQGSAYVFTRAAGTWTEQAKLTASDGAPLDQLGFSVAVSEDDVLVGAKSLAEDVNVAPQGSAYVFTRTGGDWTQQKKLIPSDGFVGDGFGFRVAIDGETAVVGAVRDNGGQGSAYVFSRSSGIWAEEAILGASDGASEFGFWVGLDDDTIVVGDPSNDTKGAAYLFTRMGGRWAELQKLTASDGAKGDYFGRSVAVSGGTVVVGAQFDDADPENDGAEGSAYVFRRTGRIWREKAHLIAEDGAANDLFGVSVAVSGDTTVVGASFAKVGTKQGAAYVWRDVTHRTRRGESSATSASLVRADSGS